ncbi:hypothetical protein CWO04_09395 [Vibrio splendidus]|jgi:hypothetical protein|uniref:hypothetical protein n=1 Tax=Vibrio splendidus TaxID=29497 RepID=UPI000D35E63F|nr:hypothetical protein [Vibrio splendidus]PTP87129.1 hypothetical protein CWO04_09395 [Vibrio splendidus]
MPWTKQEIHRRIVALYSHGDPSIEGFNSELSNQEHYKRTIDGLKQEVLQRTFSKYAVQVEIAYLVVVHNEINLLNEIGFDSLRKMDFAKFRLYVGASFSAKHQRWSPNPDGRKMALHKLGLDEGTDISFTEFSKLVVEDLQGRSARSRKAYLQGG